MTIQLLGQKCLSDISTMYFCKVDTSSTHPVSASLIYLLYYGKDGDQLTIPHFPKRLSTWCPNILNPMPKFQPVVRYHTIEVRTNAGVGFYPGVVLPPLCLVASGKCGNALFPPQDFVFAFVTVFLGGSFHFPCLLQRF